MVALAENEPLATSVGIDVTRYLVLATVVSATIAGAAGVLYAHYVRIVDPDVFLFIYTVTMAIMVITGGKGTLAGPVINGYAFPALEVGFAWNDPDAAIADAKHHIDRFKHRWTTSDPVQSAA